MSGETKLIALAVIELRMLGLVFVFGEIIEAIVDSVPRSVRIIPFKNRKDKAAGVIGHPHAIREHLVLTRRRIEKPSFLTERNIRDIHDVIVVKFDVLDVFIEGIPIVIIGLEMEIELQEIIDRVKGRIIGLAKEEDGLPFGHNPDPVSSKSA